MDKDSFTDKIIDKAGEIFNQFGFKKTTMDEIAQQLGKGKSSIYYYFKSKEEIFEAVVEKEANKLRNEVKSAIDQASDPIDKIKNYVLTRVRVYKEVTNFYNALKNDGLLHLDFIDSLRKKYELSEIEILQQILIEGVNAGKFKLNNTHLASIAVVTALKGLEETFNKSEDDESLEKQLDNLLNILFYGIIVR